MISFRYHLVSIVSVFLALALGVLVGTTVVNEGLIQDLNRRTEDVAKDADDLRRQVSDLRDEVQIRDQFAQAAERVLIEDRLTGREVVLVTLEGVDVSDVDGVRRALEDGGASVVAEMVITARMALTDQVARSDLAAAIGMLGSTGAEELSQSAAQQLGSRLATGPDPVEADLLADLATSGFVDVLGGVTFDQIGGEDQATVLLAGGVGEPLVEPELFLAPLTEALAQAFRPVVAAETLDSEYPFVAIVRDNGAIAGSLVTVDNADQLPGRVAIVLGLHHLLLTPGRGGDYGVKDGAGSLLPQP
jgi:hypothetical protein